MTPEEAIAYYLTPTNPPTGNLFNDLVTAGAEAARWRVEGPRATATIISTLNLRFQLSYREIENLTGISRETARRLVEKHIDQDMS